MRALLPFAVAVTAAFAPAAAAGPAMTAVEQQSVQQALDRGALLYAYDQAAWHGTDDFVAKAGDARAQAGGWIVDGPVAAPELVFVTRGADPHFLYVADFRDGRLVEGHMVQPGTEATLSPVRRRMVAALVSARAALAADKAAFACAKQPFNTVVVPPPTPDAPVPGYFLTPQTETDVYPLGGHFRADVGADGKVAIRPFTKACLPMHREVRKDGTVAGLVVSHLLDPTPTEIHVFFSLAARLPIYVVTGDRVWAVEGNRIRLVEGRKP